MNFARAEFCLSKKEQVGDTGSGSRSNIGASVAHKDGTAKIQPVFSGGP